MRTCLFCIGLLFVSSAMAFPGQPKKFECQLFGNKVNLEINEIPADSVKWEKVKGRGYCYGVVPEGIILSEKFPDFTLESLTAGCLEGNDGSITFTGNSIYLDYNGPGLAWIDVGLRDKVRRSGKIESYYDEGEDLDRKRTELDTSACTVEVY